MGANLEITKSLENYIEKFSYNLHPIQKEIINYNKTLGHVKKMQISLSQCHFLHLIIKLSNLKNILEIGTFTGLSTLSMSLALPDEGRIVALDIDKKTNKVALDFFEKANQDKKIKTIIKPALESLSDLEKNNQIFDMIFIDADKENYRSYYESSIKLLNKGGLIIVDNVLWHGDVVDVSKNDKYTNAIKDLNDFAKNDKRTEQMIIPLGDGLNVCRKL